MKILKEKIIKRFMASIFLLSWSCFLLAYGYMIVDKFSWLAINLLCLSLFTGTIIGEKFNCSLKNDRKEAKSGKEDKNGLSTYRKG